jgi:hypothetical protein
MFSTLFSTTLLLLSVLQVVLADFPVNGPAITQCKDAKITWDKTKGPYNVIVVHSNDMCGDPIADLGDHSQNHMTWHKVPLIAGDRVVISVEDSTGDEGWTGTLTVLPSDDTSCLSDSQRANVSASHAAAAAASTTASSTLVVPPAQTSGAKAAGAANAGLNPLDSSAQHSMSKTSTPVLWITALFALLSLSL